jgi:hypothetical protein
VATSLLPPMLPVDRESIGPSMLMRKHSGYANDAGMGSGGYESLWESQDGVRLPAAPNPIRPVFLVNSQTSIPATALSVQNSGAGAIVSEDAISDQQIAVSRLVPVLGNLRVQVRAKDLAYPDGTTGIAANVVLHKTGTAVVRRKFRSAASSQARNVA